MNWIFKEDKDCTEFYPEATEQEKENGKILNEFYYKFRAVRLKDEETKKEFLKLTVYIRNSIKTSEYKEDAEAIINMKNLDNHLIELREYGIVFTDDNNRLKLKREIENSYRSIKLELNEETGEFKEKRFNEFLSTMYEYFNLDKEEENELVRDGLCYIDVKMFRDLVSDTGYKEFEMQSLKRKLKKEKFIVADKNRYTKLFRTQQKKVMRTIAFDKIQLKNIKKQSRNI